MDQVDVSRVMADVRSRASAELRGRTDFSDAEIFTIVEQILREAIDAADQKTLLLQELIAGRPELNLEPVARLSSHRPVIGPLILFVKRRVLQPLSRWLYEYSMDNFERQARINRIMFAALQALAVENAKLRKRSSGTA
jgi:hypothetical protein